MTATAPEAPPHPDRGRWHYEMLYAGLTRRAYADNATALMVPLCPGYLGLSPAHRWEARLLLAARAQVACQAVYNTAETLTQMPVIDQKIAQGPRHTPPTVPHWNYPTPLILIATYYAPLGRIPKPQPVDGLPANIIWIDPTDDLSLLESLHDIDYIALHEQIPADVTEPSATMGKVE